MKFVVLYFTFQVVGGREPSCINRMQESESQPGGGGSQTPELSNGALELSNGASGWDLIGAELPEFSVASFEDDASLTGELEDALQGYDGTRELDRSWVQLNHQPLQHFWETGFWSHIFGSGQPILCQDDSLVRPAVVPEPPELVSAASGVVKLPGSKKRVRAASFLDVVVNKPAQSWMEQRDATWETAMRRWHSCIMTWYGDEALINIIQSRGDFRAQCQVIVDVLHNKAPSTLLKRCGSIARLVNDLTKHGQTFPCSEPELYEHLCRHRDLGVKKSRLKSLLEAVTFVRHIFNIVSLDECTKSRRCMGVATSTEVSIVKQAPPLMLMHLNAIHSLLDNSDDPWEVCFCGMVLFCVYGRARWSDAQHSQFLTWDRDATGVIRYVECATAVHKTCRALSMRHLFLPLTAPAFGAGPNNWADRWKAAREQLGIENLGNFPLMPAPQEDLTPSVRPLMTSEASKWLALVLNEHFELFGGPEPLPYTSHSFKAKTLSYLAKMGCGFTDRLALGYHVGQISMALRYSRDGASRPLRVLEDCLEKIRSGCFRPDETRSGRFVDVATGKTDVPVKEETTGPEVLDVNEPAKECVEVVSSDHATTSSGSDSDDDAVVFPRLPYRTALVPEGAEVWKHVKLRTVHFAPAGWYRNVLSCGRRITDKYEKSTVDIRFDFIKCKQCFARHAEQQP